MSTVQPTSARRCDIFCTVIDNYGDLGVCWRLARQLAEAHGCVVTLWVDDLSSLAHMHPSVNPQHPEQRLGRITLRHWSGDSGEPAPGGLIISGFGCRLPEDFLQAMATRQSVWINLEYLSAEAWIDGCHGLPSIQAATGLTQHFWFPGFTPASGGLLRESALLAARDAFQTDPMAGAAFWQAIGWPQAAVHDRRMSLFAYENGAISGWLHALSADDKTTFLAVPAGRALVDIARWAGVALLQAGDSLQRGALTIAVLPFLTHEDYDRLLWACDLNAVRGEDSFVRAQWAARPLLWHIYPQEEQAHEVKLMAWMDRVRAVTPNTPPAWFTAQLAWNQHNANAAVWSGLLSCLPALLPSATRWAADQSARDDLATGLMRFYTDRVESTPVKSHPGSTTR